jgi:hypothetical protein
MHLSYYSFNDMNCLFKISLFGVASASFFLACTRSSIGDGKIARTDTGVYIAGVVNDTATIWANGTESRLPPPYGVLSRALTIFVADTNIYVAGLEGTSAVLWKNGQKTVLTQNGTATGVYVSDMDLYVCGQDGPNPVYWKNGVEVPLSVSPGATGGAANAIVVSGSDVYIAGMNYFETGPAYYTGVASYWKNGQLQELEADTIFSQAQGISLSGDDVYITGLVSHSGYRATYWKNGVSTEVSMVSSSSSSIFVNGNDIYMSGEELVGNTYQLTLWKNGVPKHFGYSDLGFGGNSVFVSGNDVYLAGMLYLDMYGATCQATWWKNDSAFPIGPIVENEFVVGHFGSVATCIFHAP